MGREREPRVASPAVVDPFPSDALPVSRADVVLTFVENVGGPGERSSLRLHTPVASILRDWFAPSPHELATAVFVYNLRQVGKFMWGRVGEGGCAAACSATLNARRISSTTCQMFSSNA